MSQDLAAHFNRLLARDQDQLRCPYPTYANLRDESPAYWSDALNAFVVTRYADVLEVLRDPGTWSSASQSGSSSVSGLARELVDDETTPERLRCQAERRLEINEHPTLLNADPPDHIRQRKLVSQGFTPRRVALMEPEMREIAGGLLDEIAKHESVDLVQTFAMPLPMTIIARVLGVPERRMHDFKRWSDAFTRGVGADALPPDEVASLFEAIDEFYDFFTEEIDRRRETPRDDLLSDLVAARLDGEQPLTINEMLQMIVVFLVGGNETTTNLLAALVHRILTEPGLRDRVRQEPEVLPNLVEEMLRLESPVQGLFRTATRDTEISGVKVEKGQTVWMVFASANRDPAAFASPDSLDIDTKREQRHLAFGRGEHLCLGAPIARLEARVAIEMLFARFPDLRLTDQTPAPVHDSFVLHGIASLPVEVRAG